MSTVLTDLTAGHQFDTVTFAVDAQRVRAYLAATGDPVALYEKQNVAPPLAVAAFALGALLEAVTLPEGVSQDGILRVKVATAPWASELQMMTPKIIGRLNTGRPARPITGIRWVVGSVAPDRTL